MGPLNQAGTGTFSRAVPVLKPHQTLYRPLDPDPKHSGISVGTDKNTELCA